eukprot:349186-Prymnesium_polylepis.1
MGTTHKHDFQGLGRKNAFPHHNKHPPKPEHKFEGDSTYNLTYKKWPAQPIYQHPSPLVARSYPGMCAPCRRGARAARERTGCPPAVASVRP